MYFVQTVSNKCQVNEMKNSQTARRAKEINCKVPFRQDMIVSGRKYAQYSRISTLIHLRFRESIRNKGHRGIQCHLDGRRTRYLYSQSSVHKYALKRNRTIIMPFKIIAED